MSLSPISLASHPLKLTSPIKPIPENVFPSRERSSNASLGESVSDSTDTARSSGYFSDNTNVESDASTPYTSADESDEPEIKPTPKRFERRRASTILVSKDSAEARKILGLPENVPFASKCCGGGCCMIKELQLTAENTRIPVWAPQNAAYKSLNVKLGSLSLDSELTGLVDMPVQTVFFERVGQAGLPAGQQIRTIKETTQAPPKFVQPHPPYEVYSAPVHHARELTKPGADKRTFHFDIDVTDYPVEGGVDFVVGGAIGVQAPNDTRVVDGVFDCLNIPKFLRDRPILVHTTTGRWPTIWGDDKPRTLVSSRRDLLTWCSDIQSYPPTKQLFRLMAEYSDDASERKILSYLASSQGQGAFCDLRSGPYVTILQILSAFPSSNPPLDYLLSVFQTLMPRFYSLSQDPTVSTERNGESRKIVEIAVSVHETDDWQEPLAKRTGVGSGFLERVAKQIIQAEKDGIDPHSLDLRLPMFRGLMSNPLAKEFKTDGPMLLVGAGVGIAPFRGFVHRRLKSANCANKVWVLQGIRDSLVDELYAGDWGVHEEKVKKVVQSRKASGKYVQDEVRNQADLVWSIINALDGRIFVCGSSKGMGEGVEKALMEVSMDKGGMNEQEAKVFWEQKKKAGQYIAETW